jgi:hypothetical protein
MIQVPEPQPGKADRVSILHLRGGKVLVRGATPGLAVVVDVSYARCGLADPFEVLSTW